MSIDKKPTTKSADEVDYVHAKKYYSWKPGIGKWIKNKMNRRFRKKGKEEARKGLDE